MLCNHQHGHQKQQTKTDIKGQLARQTRQAIATSSSQTEDQRIRHQLEDDLNVAQVCLSSLIEDCTKCYLQDGVFVVTVVIICSIICSIIGYL